MAWKDNLRPGSFRDVPFATESANASIGRRTVVHEYPLRDTPYVEDLGRKARRIEMTIYVLGADYMSARDALIAAFEESGPGELVHPYLGKLTATAVEVRGPRESTREGGMARFQVTFVEAGEAVFPKSSVDTATTATAAADSAADAAKNEFSSNFGAAAPASAAIKAKTFLENVAGRIDAIRRSFPGVPDAVTDYVRDLETVAQSLEELIRTPADLADSVYGLVADIAVLPDRIERAFGAYGQLWDLFADDSDITEPKTVTIASSGAAVESVTMTRQARNEISVNALVRRAAVIEAVRATTGIEYESQVDAAEAREELAEKLDAEAVLTADDDCYTALVDLRAAMIADLTARGADLAVVEYHTPAADLPAVVLAHMIYGDAAEAEAIVSRNNIAHPGFVPGGEALEVLIDG